MSGAHEAFWSAAAPRYDRVVDLQIGPATRAMVRDRLGAEGRLGTVAEFGCGTGFYTEVLAQKADAVVATDVAPGMLALAQSRIDAPNVTFRAEDGQRTSFPDETFDAVFMSLVLHFTEPATTLAEMHRILKPGGMLVVESRSGRAPRLDRVRSLVRIAYRGLAGYRTKPPKRFGRNVLGERELRELLVGTGFDVVTAETFCDRSRSSHIPVEYVKAVKKGRR